MTEPEALQYLKSDIVSVGEPLKVAMVGSRGIPHIYGGIERHVAEISVRLAQRGHRVTIFGRSPYSKKGIINGVNVKVIPAVHTKSLETASNSFISSIVASLGGFDIIHFHGVGPSFFSWIPFMFGRRVVSTIHAPDYLQKKWGPVARFFLMSGERNALKFSSASIVVSRKMMTMLKSAGYTNIYYVPNGANVKSKIRMKEALSYGIEPEKYILAVGRFIVEKGFDLLIDAFNDIDSNIKLVIAGDSSFEDGYSRKLKERASDRVVFTGYVSGRLLDELYSNCLVYCLPSTLEGLPISLIEAMGFGKPVIVSNIEENLEVAGDVGLVFKSGNIDDLRRAISEILSMSDQEREKIGRRAREKVEEYFNWDKISLEIEKIYIDVLSKEHT